MERDDFNKLFLRNVCLLSLLVLGSTAFSTGFTSDEDFENIKVLVTAESGLQFYKEDTPARKIIYDCELWFEDKGTIDIFDGRHPNDMTSLIIKNCYEITLLSSCNAERFSKFQELIISNVTSLTLSKCDWQWSYASSVTDLKVSINNVRFLKVNNFFKLLPSSRFSVKLQNVLIDTLTNLFGDPDHRILFDLHLKNVKVNVTSRHAVHLKGNPYSRLILENSHFGDVDRDAFVFKGTVEIINNTFNLLDEAAFSINTSDPFLFSGNHVKRMLNPFNIFGSEVNIINNTFDSIVTPWLPKILRPEIESFRVLNITGNKIHHWSYNSFYMEPQNFPDVVIFEGNYLNCSCKNVLTLAYKFRNYIPQVFLNKQQNNFCHNLGNCPLHKALRQESGICSNTFRCPEDDENENDQNDRMWPSHVKSILSVLKNIDLKLDQIVSKRNLP